MSSRARDRLIVDLFTHPDEHITPQAFAEHLDVDARTVMKWINCGLLTADKFDTKIRIQKIDAVLFVERSRIKPKT